MTNQVDVQEVAYKLWEAAGRPEGQDIKYWNEASILVNIANKPNTRLEKSQATPEHEKAIERAQPDQT